MTPIVPISAMDRLNMISQKLSNVNMDQLDMTKTKSLMTSVFDNNNKMEKSQKDHHYMEFMKEIRDKQVSVQMQTDDPEQKTKEQIMFEHAKEEMMKEIYGTKYTHIGCQTIEEDFPSV